jgi:hypothetical protein
VVVRGVRVAAAFVAGLVRLAGVVAALRGGDGAAFVARLAGALAAGSVVALAAGFAFGADLARPGDAACLPRAGVLDGLLPCSVAAMHPRYAVGGLR